MPQRFFAAEEEIVILDKGAEQPLAGDAPRFQPHLGDGGAPHGGMEDDLRPRDR